LEIKQKKNIFLIAKKGEGERSGRDYDKEQVMEKLRALGYY